jgi:hypothetical protein
MAEQTAALPINGEELIKVIQFKVGEVLRRDCFLKEHMAYMEFGGSVDVHLWLGGVIRKVTIETEVDLGPKPDQVEQEHDAGFEIENMPPDELRVETDQPVLMSTKDENGRTVLKPVHYARKKK